MSEILSEESAQALNGLRVLILEPDPSMRRLMEVVLERAGCRVSSAAGPGPEVEDSIEFVLSNHRYLAVMDLYPDCLHLFMSSAPIASNGPRVYEMILKPFPLGDLSRRMTSMLKAAGRIPGVTPASVS